MTNPDNPDTAQRYGRTPLGKSVEEVERESGERHTIEQQSVPVVIPSSMGSIPAVINPGALLDRSGQAPAEPAQGHSETTEEA